MKCEEFEWMGLDADSARRNVDGQTWAAAMEHANTCTQCAALLRSWRAAQVELQFLQAATQNAETPARVEMRLRQAVRHQRGGTRRKFALFSAWALATAAVWMAAASWRSWHDQHRARKGESLPAAAQGTGQNKEIVHKPSVPGTETSTSVWQPSAPDTYAADDLNDFTFLPGSVPVENGDSEILRVRLQRGALGALGLPVNEERAGEWLQVDLLVTEDGQPQAVRLVR